MVESGKTRKEVAAELGIHRNTVCQRLKQSPLAISYRGRRKPALPEAVEAEVLALLKSGRGTSWIGKHLGISEHQVQLVADKFNFRRKRGERGYRYHVSASQREKIMEEILGRRNFCRTLAFKYKVSDKFVRKLAHELLGVPEFRGGYGEPLSSNFPLKHEQVTST